MGRRTPTFPHWWDWDLEFYNHAYQRMEHHYVTELDVRAMLERAAGFEPSASLGRFKIHTRYKRRAWIVVVEPDDRFNLLMVVTAYEVY